MASDNQHGSGAGRPSDTRYLKETPSQTAGPYVHIGLSPGAAGFNIYDNELGNDIAGPNAKGTRIRVEGVVSDGTGTPVRDVLLETWQANASGHYVQAADQPEIEPGFRGWGRSIADFETGEWGFDTIKPGKVQGLNNTLMAPHISFFIAARGINNGLNTRMYFDDETKANAADPILNLIEWPTRRQTLLATYSDREGIAVYRFNIQLQGDNETVFFDI